MPLYRLFRLSLDNKIVGPAAVFAFVDDDEALRHGETLADGHAIEVGSVVAAWG
jgi:hypothetical protein